MVASGKELDCHCRRHEFVTWAWKIPWMKTWQPTPVLLPGESHGSIQRQDSCHNLSVLIHLHTLPWIPRNGLVGRVRMWERGGRVRDWGRVHKKPLQEMEPISGPLITVNSESVGRSVCPTLQPARLLCLWNSPFKNIGVGHSLLGGIVPTQGSDPGSNPSF